MGSEVEPSVNVPPVHQVVVNPDAGHVPEEADVLPTAPMNAPVERLNFVIRDAFTSTAYNRLFAEST